MELRYLAFESQDAALKVSEKLGNEVVVGVDRAPPLRFGAEAAGVDGRKLP